MPYGVLFFYRRIKNKRPENEKPLCFNFTVFEDHKTNNYGQGNEDVLLRLFMQKPNQYKGFYIDIGAFHPIIYSNTKYFYDIGWNGINIDANENSINEFNKYRARDINVCCGVSDEYGELDFYCFGDQSTINTLDKRQAKAFEVEFKTKIKEIKKVPVQPINNILEKYCTIGQHIDLITIDVEGFEMRILRSLDFIKYAPDYFLIEDLDNRNKNYEKFKDGCLYKFMKNKGYNAIGKTDLTYLFQKENIEKGNNT